jgi:hypothetical protein
MMRRIFDGQRLLAPVIACLGALALVGCFTKAPPAVSPPPDPPSGEIQPDEVIAYEQLAEHLRFNTKSRMRLLALVGREIQVHGPVWQVEHDWTSDVLRLGSERASVVRANFANPGDLQGVCPGQEVDVIGALQFRSTEVILESARLKP